MNRISYSLALSVLVVALASCGGGGGSSASNAPAAQAQAPGEAVYRSTCMVCHQAQGEGIAGSFPPLAKSDFLADRGKTIRQVIKGGSGEIVVNGVKYNGVMPPQSLKDEEVAAVLTYVYSSFGNTGAAVTVDEVKAAKANP
jgi:mono/diheme cytochrome c family protein